MCVKLLIVYDGITHISIWFFQYWCVCVCVCVCFAEVICRKTLIPFLDGRYGRKEKDIADHVWSQLPASSVQSNELITFFEVFKRKIAFSFGFNLQEWALKDGDRDPACRR